ncbi:MAG: hypothetical protein JXB32_10300 [Deltaproteobacteria bacterium]|nr:hypothetical protein [Deltaproteobacteria bacterium]
MARWTSKASLVLLLAAACGSRPAAPSAPDGPAAGMPPGAGDEPAAGSTEPAEEAGPPPTAPQEPAAAALPFDCSGPGDADAACAETVRTWAVREIPLGASLEDVLAACARLGGTPDEREDALMTGAGTRFKTVLCAAPGDGPLRDRLLFGASLHEGAVFSLTREVCRAEPSATAPQDARPMAERDGARIWWREGTHQVLRVGFVGLGDADRRREQLALKDYAVLGAMAGDGSLEATWTRETQLPW